MTAVLQARTSIYFLLDSAELSDIRASQVVNLSEGEHEEH